MALPGATDPLLNLFEGLPHVMFSLKDERGRYLAANQAFADRAGCRGPGDVVGRSAGELFSPELARSYEAQDAVLLATGRPVRRHLEIITRPDGSLGWYVTNKTLVPSQLSEHLAIAAVSVDEHAPVDDAAMEGLRRALAHVRAHATAPVALSALSAIAGMSPAALERRMRRVLGLSPRQLLLRVRLEEAVHRLVRSDEPLATIAAACGFFDQAAMTRQMHEVLGVTPGAMRKASAVGKATRRGLGNAEAQR
ncbi:MAG: helix-turn-helix domain-containing protein [Actinomycetota bacterium]|nr:helix-turn-helix domain-containing protein [Actinomycetota bacterium]